MGEHSRRLDSWKEIAEYLGRDVRTVMRWAKSQGLPVRRVAGGKGRSVFAFTDEIDAWLAGGGESPQPPDALQAPARRGPSAVVVGPAVLIVLIAVGIAVIPRVWTQNIDPRDVRVAADAAGVWVSDASHPPALIYKLDPSAVAGGVGEQARTLRLEPGGDLAIVVAVSSYNDASTTTRTGDLTAMDTNGRVIWRAEPRFALKFRDETFQDAYALTGWHISSRSGPARIAMTAHHWMWWASPIAIVDHQGRVGEPFVNPGWVESVAWLDDDRIVAGGFNNLRDAAAIMLIDTRRMNGQAPGTKGTQYECMSCGPDAPVFYATMPRSELNRATGSRFNAARLEVTSDRIVATTIEIPQPAGSDRLTEPATTIYEFAHDMTLLRARHSEPYWNWHRKLELEGTLKHSREACPERDGPPYISAWTPEDNSFVTRLQYR